MAEMLKHDAAVSCYGRWDDQDKVWNDASLMLGAHVEAAVVADVIVDTPEEIEALPDDQEVITPVENVMGSIVNVNKTDVENGGSGQDSSEGGKPTNPTPDSSKEDGGSEPDAPKDEP